MLRYFTVRIVMHVLLVLKRFQSDKRDFDHINDIVVIPMVVIIIPTHNCFHLVQLLIEQSLSKIQPFFAKLRAKINSGGFSTVAGVIRWSERSPHFFFMN